METWRPAEREPDALHKALYEYLRKRAPQVYLEGQSTAQPLGRSDVVLEGDRTLAIDLTITPIEQRTFRGRDAIAYDVAGHAGDANTGYEVGGTVIVDTKTLAFLSIEVNPTVVNRRP